MNAAAEIATGAPASREALARLVKAGSLLTASEGVNRVTRIVTAIALARALPVAEFGIAAAALTTHELTRMFIQNGLGARIVTVPADQVQVTAAAVHRMNWALGLTLMAMQLVAAWPVGRHFESSELSLAIGVLALVHVVYPAAMVQVYLAQRAGAWNVVTIAMASQAAIDNLLTAALAIAGAGIWAVVIPKVLVALLWIAWHRRMTPWVPKERPIAADYQRLAKFAGGVLGVEMLATLRNHADKALVGILLGPVALGLYAFAANIGRGIVLSVSSSLASVILPHLANARQDGRLADAHRHSLWLAVASTVPFTLGVAALSPWLVPLLFGPQWEPATMLVSVLAVAATSHPVLLASSQLMRTLDRPATDLALGGAMTLATFAGLAASLPLGLLPAVAIVAGGQIAVAAVAVAVSLSAARAASANANQERPT